MAESMTPSPTPCVDLGFLEECAPWLLTNTYFPSKVGGKPAWLELDHIPQLDQMKCRMCQEVMVFLCQVYASQEDIDHCFHRSIFVFVCKNSSCWQPNCSKHIVAFRCQLPRTNKFYSYEPPNDEVRQDAVPPTANVCEVCGIRGPYNCSNCKQANYCSSGHQKIDWLRGHKNQCKHSSIQPPNEEHPFLLPEFELVIEAEDTKSSKSGEETEEAAEERRRTEAARLETEQTGELSSLPEADLMQFAGTTKDPVFSKFQKRVNRHKDQVLRYDRGGDPLWISDRYTLKSDKVPNCDLCNSRRIFEFQIMPQMLNSIKEPAFDWGIINVYTCENNCNIGDGYVKEYCFKQDIN